MTVLSDTIGGRRAGPLGQPPADRWALTMAGLGLLLGAAFVAQAIDGRQAGLFLIGGALGAVLFHAAFGFTGAWRAFLRDGDGTGLRAQMLMIALASVFFLPLVVQGSAFGQPVGGTYGPVGVSVFVGAFLFGLGMQLGGGCGSGTLFTVGGGSVRMLVTLAFFIVGSVIGSAHLSWWLDLPSFGAISLGHTYGPWPALAFQLVLLALVAGAVTAWEWRRRGPRRAAMPEPAAPVVPMPARLWRGPWPLIWGGVALALLNVVTLIVAGHPWSITSAFALWGAKISAALGIEIAAWEGSPAVQKSVLANTVSVMNFGLVLGAALAAAAAGRFAPSARLPIKSALAAVTGGLLMGYGARLGFGCNIGAMFSGIASGSVHGWLWFGAAFAGSALGVRIRPRFGLAR